MKKKLKYWKLGLHLILRTRRLGVNNLWSCQIPSLFGINPLRGLIDLILIYPLIFNYQSVKWRMGQTMGFVSQKEYRQYFNSSD